MHEEPKNQLTTPMAIVIAGIFIALAVYLTKGQVPQPYVRPASQFPSL
jgi:preprotein translocase subunit Sec61beta